MEMHLFACFYGGQGNKEKAFGRAVWFASMTVLRDLFSFDCGTVV